MSTAMEIIERANRENRGIVIILSGKEMERRIPIRVCYKSRDKNGILQEQESTSHGEVLTLDIDLSGGINGKVAYVCDKKRTKVKLSEFLITDSVKKGKPVYAFLSAHIFRSIDELDISMREEIPFIPKVENPHYMSEW